MSRGGRPPTGAVQQQQWWFRVWGDYRSRGVRVGVWERTVRCGSSVDALDIAERDERRASRRGGGVHVAAKYILASWRATGDG